MRRNWLDVVVDWATGRTVPAWVWAIVLTGVLAGVFGGVTAAGGYEAGDVRLAAYGAFYLPCALVLYGVSRNRALRAFDEFAPAVSWSDAEAARERAALVRFSPLRVAAWMLAGGAVGLGTVVGTEHQGLYLGNDPLSYLVMGGLGLFLSYGAVIAAAAFGVTLLVRVTRLHRAADHVDIYRSGPAHAFARVTSAISVIFLLLVSFSAATDPATFATAVGVVLIVVMVVSAVLMFVLPLLGMRARLSEAKEARKDEVLALLDGVESGIRGQVKARKYAGVEDARAAAGALREDLARVDAASTWPWDARAPRTVATSLLIPLATWFLTTGAAQVFGW